MPDIIVTTPTGETSKINGDEEPASGTSDVDKTSASTKTLNNESILMPDITLTTPTGEMSKINGDEGIASGTSSPGETAPSTEPLDESTLEQPAHEQLGPSMMPDITVTTPTGETSKIHEDGEAASGTSNFDKTATVTIPLDENPSKQPGHDQPENNSESTMSKEKSKVRGDEEAATSINYSDLNAKSATTLDKTPLEQRENEQQEKKHLPAMSKKEAEYRAKIEQEGWTHLPPPPPAGATLPFTLPPQQIPVFEIPETYTPTVPVGWDDDWADDDGYSEGTGNEYDEGASLADGPTDYHDFGPTTDEGTPHVWEDWQDYVLYAQRGNLMEVTAQMQAYFQFDPPVSLGFIMSRLCGEPATRHMFFLTHYLPGETVTMFRARQRVQARTAQEWEAFNLTEPREALIHLITNPPENTSVRPPLPDPAPPTWSRRDDAILNTFLNNFEHPHAALVYFGASFGDELTLEFLSIRMAQSMHLQLAGWELRLAMEWRERRMRANGL